MAIGHSIISSGQRMYSTPASLLLVYICIFVCLAGNVIDFLRISLSTNLSSPPELHTISIHPTEAVTPHCPPTTPFISLLFYKATRSASRRNGRPRSPLLDLWETSYPDSAICHPQLSLPVQTLIRQGMALLVVWYQSPWILTVPIIFHSARTRKKPHRLKVRWRTHWTTRGSFSCSCERQCGPGFSSDISGDGPIARCSSMRQDSLKPAEPPFNGEGWIFIPWESFSSWHSYYNLPLSHRSYHVQGKYISFSTRKGKMACEIWCPALSSNFQLDDAWIKKFGSNTDPGSRTIITHQLLLQHEAPTADPSIGPPTPTTRMAILGNPCPLPFSPSMIHTGDNTNDLTGIGVWNVNSLSGDIKSILGLMHAANLSVCVCIDTRSPPASRQWLEQLSKRVHPSGKLLFSEQRGRIGGICVVADSTWGLMQDSTYNDPSNLGIVFEVTFKSGEFCLRLIAVYWPVTRSVPGSESLHSLLEAWLLSSGRDCNPEEYIKEILASRIKRPSDITIVCGDLNCTPSSDRLKWLRTLLPHDAHQNLLPFATHYAGERAGNHLDYLLYNNGVVGGGYSPDPAFGTFSDHVPIWGRIKAPTDSIPRIPKSVRPPRPMQMDYSNADKVEAMQAYVAEAIKTTSSLADITHCIVQGTSKPGKPHKWQPWSPGLAGRLLSISTLKKIQSTSWRASSRLDHLKATILKLGADGQEVWNDLLPILGPLRHKSGPELLAAIQAACRLIKKDFHGRRRKELHQIFAASLLRRQQAKYLFRELGLSKFQLDLSHLQHDNTTIWDPKEIHDTITSSFAAKFGPHIYADQRLDGNFDEICANYREIFSNPAVPSNLFDSFTRALTSTQGKRTKVLERLAQLATVGPSLAQFLLEIQRSSSSSAPGASGLCYKMLKYQSPEVTSKLHRLLVDQWQSNALEGWLNSKVMILIPKKEDQSTLANMRPIVLVEVLRKLFVGCFTRVIRTSWEAEGILQAQQHGFRPSRGTLGCVLQMLNLWESAEELYHPLYFSSWDIKDAFPSVPRFVAYTALCRLGVPERVSTFLATLDLQETIRVSTPFSDTNKDSSTFHTQRGLGQGDKGSPTIWNAVMDILLTMVGQVPSQLLFPTAGGTLHEGSDTAYADDLVTYGASWDILQAKADRYSAGAALLGLEIAVHKLRTGAVGVINPPDIIVHNSNWTPMAAPFSAPKDFLKYLGMKKRMDGSSTCELADMRKKLVEALGHLRGKLCTTQGKLRFLQGAIFPKVSYAGSFAVGSLKRFRDLDTPVGLFLKEMLHLPTNWPTTLLYTPTKYGGKGLPRLSDVIQQTKLRLLFSGLRGDTNTRAAAAGLLLRNQRTQSQGSWLCSLTDYLSEHNCELRCGSTSLPALPESAIKVTPGQFWEIEGKILQVGGWTATKLMGWEWAAASSRKRPRGDTPLQQGGFTELTRGGIGNTPTSHHALSVEHISQRLVRITDRIPADPWTHTSNPEPIAWPRPLAMAQLGLIATDGSWTASCSISPSPPTTGAGAALLYTDMRHAPISLHLPNAYKDVDQRNYAQELVGLLIGAAALEDSGMDAVIHTDCQSAIDALAGKRLGKTYPLSQLLHLLKHKLRGKHLRWTKAHTTNNPLPLCTPTYGNYLADKAAGGDPHAFQLAPNFLQSVADSAQLWYVYDRAEQAPATLPVQGGYKAASLNYYSERPNRHAYSPSLNQVQLCLEAHPHSTPAQKGALLKLLLDRFNDDRLWEEKLLPSCDCEQVAHLSSWVHSCTCPDIASLRREAISEVQSLLANYPILANMMTGKLQEPNSYNLWRCRWSKGDIDDYSQALSAAYPPLAENNFRHGTKLLHQLLRTIASAALNLHTIGTKARQGKEVGPAPMPNRSGAWARLSRNPASSNSGSRKRTRDTSLPSNTLPRITSFFHPIEGVPRKKSKSILQPGSPSSTGPPAEPMLSSGDLPTLHPPSASASTSPVKRMRAGSALELTHLHSHLLGAPALPNPTLETMDFAVITNRCK